MEGGEGLLSRRGRDVVGCWERGLARRERREGRVVKPAGSEGIGRSDGVVSVVDCCAGDWIAMGGAFASVKGCSGGLVESEGKAVFEVLRLSIIGVMVDSR